MSGSGYRRLRLRVRRRKSPLRRLVALCAGLVGLGKRGRKRRRASPLVRLLRFPGRQLDGWRRARAPHPSRLEHPSGDRRHRRRRGRLPIVLAVLKLGLLMGMEVVERAARLVSGLWRHPALSLAVGLSALWLGWPLLAPALLPLVGAAGRRGATNPPVEVISVFVEDPTRSIWALDLWKNKPGALLVMQGRPSSQIANRQYLSSQGLLPASSTRVITLEPGCDTVGQVAALARLLQAQPRPGRVTMVTSNAHLPRTLAIARTVLGPMGWKVEGLAVVTQDNRPEQPIRRLRDQIRAQMLRFTGITGSREDTFCG
ncbi:MAG: ElyC/SanA/YdcF family protein [Cyanobium sp.]